VLSNGTPIDPIRCVFPELPDKNWSLLLQNRSANIRKIICFSGHLAMKNTIQVGAFFLRNKPSKVQKIAPKKSSVAVLKEFSKYDYEQNTN
jgi:hypothetical protein